MGTNERPAIAGATADQPVRLVNGGRSVAKMLWQDGIKEIFKWPGSAVN